MMEMISYILVAVYAIICDIGISSWVKRSIDQPVHESRKKWLKFYRSSMLSATLIIMAMGVGVYFQFIVIK